MDHARFVALKRDQWSEFETQLDEARAHPNSLSHEDLETLAFQFRQILHDHALSSARFPATAASERLRSLALAGTHFLHADRSRKIISLKNMHTRFTTELRRQRSETVVAVLLFLVAGIFGFMIASVRPEIGLTVLGPERIAGLREGHLWTESLTTSVPPSVSSSFIATNNMSVALMSWGGGILAGLGPINVCLMNGYLLGAIVAVAHHWSMAGELGEFIAAHGPLEISLILVVSGAGLRIGRALVVAEKRPRSERIREAALGSVVVLLGCLPWFVLLGLVEGLISPSHFTPPLLKLVFGITLLLAFIVVGISGRPEYEDES